LCASGSQVNLANLTGLSLSYIGQPEPRREIADLETVEAISRALSIEPADLLALVPAPEMKTKGGGVFPLRRSINSHPH
jgi:hypothetical protein